MGNEVPEEEALNTQVSNISKGNVDLEENKIYEKILFEILKQAQ